MQRRDQFLTDKQGNKITGASVLVKDSDGNAATIYSINDTDGTPIPSGIVTTDSLGNYFYYARNARYSETISGTGIVQDIITDILLFDPSEFSDENYIINGDFRFWQRGTTFTGIGAAIYGPDRFRTAYQNTTAVTDWSRNQTDSPELVDGFYHDYSLQIEVTTADAVLDASTRYSLLYRMEGNDWSKLAGGPFTLSFWIKASVTGTFCVACYNTGADRGYVSEYTINAINTWEYKTIIIPTAPTTGTWDYHKDDGLNIHFTIAVGTDFYMTADEWNVMTSPIKIATSNQTNGLDTTNIFNFSGIKIQPGTLPTSYTRYGSSWEDEWSATQRYFQKSFDRDDAPSQNNGINTGEWVFSALGATTSHIFSVSFRHTMRNTATVTTYNIAAANAEVRDSDAAADFTSTTVVNATRNGFSVSATSPGGSALGNRCNIHWSADTEL